MKRNLRARAVLFGQVLPVLVAGSSLVGCEPKVRPWATEALDAGLPPGSVQAEPTAATVAPPPTASDDPGETQPPVSGLEPSAVGGQSGGAVLPEACSADAGSCVAPSDAGPVPAPCVPTGPRDCSSELDNDCDGQPDNVADDVCQCVPATIETCDEHPGFDGLGACRPGTRTCIASEDGTTSAWGACEGAVAPGEADSCAVANDDTDCDGIPSEGCNCVDGVVQTGCGSSTDLGVCAFGTTTCVNGAFGECVGAIPPAARDTCAPGDDSNCNGIPNEGCACVNGETEPCGPENVGVCRSGVRTCVNGVFGQCVGAVNATSRNCSSAADNDCDGRPDNTIDNVCQCVIGTTQSCGTHPQDGIGSCRAGTQQCTAGLGSSSSAFGSCTGSIGPAAADLCDGSDTNCNGVVDDGCLQPVGVGEPCEDGSQCSSGRCESFFVDEDNDGVAASTAGVEKLCQTPTGTFLPIQRTRREPTGPDNTDCDDSNFDVKPSQENFFINPIPGRSPSDPLAYDYNCDGDSEFRYRDEYERSVAPGGASTCGFAAFDICDGGRIWQQSTTCGAASFVEICGSMDPQTFFPDLGCAAGQIVPEIVACR